MACFTMTSESSIVLDLHVTEEDTKSENEMVIDEDLNEEQEAWYRKQEEDYENIMIQLDSLEELEDIVAPNDSVTALQLNDESESPVLPTVTLPCNSNDENPDTLSASSPPSQSNEQVLGSPVTPFPTTNAQAIQSGEVTLPRSPITPFPTMNAQAIQSGGVTLPGSPITPFPTTNTQAVQSGGVILPNPNNVPTNAARPGNGSQQPPGPYPIVVDTRGGYLMAPSPLSSTGVSQHGTSFRAPVPGNLQKNVVLRTQSVHVPVTKNMLIGPPTSVPGVIMSKSVGKVQSWVTSAGIRMTTSVSNSLGTVISGAPGGHRPGQFSRRGRPPKHQLLNIAPTIHDSSLPVGIRPSMPANQIRPPGLPNPYRAGVPVPGVSPSLTMTGLAPFNNGARPGVALNNSSIPADSREVNFTKLGVGKTFPSLVVLAKPTMRMKEFTAAAITRDRAELDSQVKNLLQDSMTKLTEWLIQQGLVRSSQVCQTHRISSTGESVNLKLGMYSDVSKFPHSGGYVWICDYCPAQLFVSVFSGSIFEGAPHTPLVLLKLIYHWACQTTASNIVSWVKVESFYVKMFFTHMRAICTAAVHQNYDIMGGPNRRVEVGVISLGTAAQDGTTRNVKVEVLGVMDPESKLIRLRAVEPLQEGEKNYKRRFVKILEPLSKWVHKKSIILTDFTVDKGTLHNMGFASVFQVAVNPDCPAERIPKYCNINVMNYLRKVVPRMFQNALSLLSRQIIQQFLDELVWRERWGPVPSQAYNNIIKHIAEQTRANQSSSFLRRLTKIADDPFREWKYSVDDEVQLVSDNISKKPAALSNLAQTATVPRISSNSPPPLGPLSTTQNSSTPPPFDHLRPSIDMLPLSIRETENEEVSQDNINVKRGRKRTADFGLPSTSTEGPPSRSNSLERPKKKAPEPPGLKKSSPSYSTMVVGTEQSTSLQAYYYGTLEGDPVIINEEKKELPIFKCCVCMRKFINNILFMKHLILHAQTLTAELNDVTQCKYCLKTFPTPFSMQTHVEEVHLTSGNNDLCMICNEKFRDTYALIAHMHRTHVAFEMPYVCYVCQFRSSFHRDVIDHFYEVHNNGDKIQCPFCLKIVAICANGRRLGSNISFFLNHMQKHQRKTTSKKCKRCALWFVNKWALREHSQREHVSFKDVAGVKPILPDGVEDIRIPLPPAELGPKATLSAVRRGSNFPSRGCHSTTYLLPNLTLASDISLYNCLECKMEINESHYPGYSMCSRCRYATCCPTAMKQHMNIFHEILDNNPKFDIGIPVFLLEPMFCVCGYNTDRGNRLAKHLALCDRKSAYESLDRAKAATVQSASFPPLVTLDDVDNNGEDPSDKWLKAFVSQRRDDTEISKDSPEKKTTGADSHSMLNVLGLVRKPSTDESSLDKAPSDKEDATEMSTTGET